MKRVAISIDYLIPITVCLLISIGFARLFILSSMNRYLPSIMTGGFLEQFVWTLILTLVGLFGVTCLYWLITRNRDFELRLLVAIVVAPTAAILLIVLSQTILMVVGKMVSSFLTSLRILFSLFSAIFSVIFIMTDVFSTRVRNLVFVLYGSLLGSFLSLLLPTVSLIVLLLAVASYDLIMLNSQWIINSFHKRMRGSFEGVFSRFSYIGDNVEIGIGEFIFYSFIPSHVGAYYGADLLILTLIMIMIGVFLNIRILTKKEFLAGLSIPVFLGLIPITLRLVFYN